MLYSLLTNFDSFNSSSMGEYEQLGKDISYSGMSIYHVVFKIGVWSAIIAIIVLALAWSFNSSRTQERNDKKERTVRLCISISIFFAVISLVTLISSVGMD